MEDTFLFITEICIGYPKIIGPPPYIHTIIFISLRKIYIIKLLISYLCERGCLLTIAIVDCLCLFLYIYNKIKMKKRTVPKL